MTNNWNLSNTNIKYFTSFGIDKTLLIPISINNIKDKIVWKFTNYGEFSIRTAIWANNYAVRPYAKAKFLISV